MSIQTRVFSGIAGFARIVAKKVAAVVGLGLGFALVLALFGAASEGTQLTPLPKQQLLSLQHVAGDQFSEKSVVVLPISGVILGEPANEVLPFFSEGVVFGGVVRDQLRELVDREDVVGVLLVVDSPGGTVYGSHMIADAVKHYKEQTGKPVMAYVSGTAASGGYLAIAGVDEIVANTGSIVGSIGVISGPYKYYKDVVSEDGGLFFGGVVTQSGVETRYITAGESKDLGNPYRSLTEAEVAQVQSVVDAAYQGFVDEVVTGRSISEERVRNDTKAYIFDAVQAQEAELIDAVADRYSAYEALIQRSGESSESIKILEHTNELSPFDALLSARSSAITPQALCQTAQPLTYYGDLFSVCQ